MVAWPCGEKPKLTIGRVCLGRVSIVKSMRLCKLTKSVTMSRVKISQYSGLGVLRD